MNDVTNEVMEEEMISASEEEFPKKDRTSAAKKRRDDYRKAVNRKKICDIFGWDEMHSKGLHQLVKENLSESREWMCKKTNSKNHGYNPKIQDKKRDMAMESQLNDLKEVESSQPEELGSN